MSSCVLRICEYCWVKSRPDGRLYFPSDLFFDCDEIRSILGSDTPYATPEVHNRKFVADIGFRTKVSVKDALSFLSKWSKSECIFNACISKIGKLLFFQGGVTSIQTVPEQFIQTGPEQQNRIRFLFPQILINVSNWICAPCVSH